LTLIYTSEMKRGLKTLDSFLGLCAVKEENLPKKKSSSSSSNLSSSTELECPVCRKSFDASSIVAHAETHLSSMNKSPQQGVFGRMMKQAREQRERAYFGLELSPEGQLEPVFSFTDPRLGRGVDAFPFECSVELSNFAYQGSPAMRLFLYSNVALVAHAVSPSAPAKAPSTGSSLRKGEAIHGVAIAYVKSALQKAVRRQNVGACTRLSAFLLGIRGWDPSSDRCGASQLIRDEVLTSSRHCADELLRRLPCIALEDGTLTPGFPILVWMMCVHLKGYVLPDIFCLHILQAVEEMAKTNYRDTLLQRYNDKHSKTLLVSSNATNGDVAEGISLTARLEASPPALRTAIASIFVRTCYGGMAGDMAALRAFAYMWLDRAAPMKDFMNPEGTYAEKLHGSIGSEWQDLAQPWANLSAMHNTNDPVDKSQSCIRAAIVTFLSKTESMASDPAERLDFTLRRGDCLPEGFDPHCSQMLQEVVEKSGVSEPERIASAIWLFRGSTNKRKIWTLTPDTKPTLSASALVHDTLREAERQQSRNLVEKRDMGALWSKVCSTVKSCQEMRTAQIFLNTQRHYKALSK